MSLNHSTPALLEGRRSWPFERALVVYAIVRLVTLGAAAVVNLFTHRGLVRDLSIWDGAWFLRAVEHGWPQHLPTSHGHVIASQIAFFPLFPLLIRSLSFLTGLSPGVTGLIISAVSGLCAVAAIGLLTREFTDRATAERAALLFAVCPGGFVFNLLYAEGLLVTFIALGLLSLLRRQWLLAGVLGALASATSPVGVAFVISCLVAAGLAMQRDREWRAVVAPLLAPFGFLAWMGYLWAHTGRPMAWRLTESSGWKSGLSLLYPERVVTKFLFNPFSPTMTGQILVVGTVLGGIGLWLVYRQRQPAPVVAYATSAVSLFLFSSPIGLRPRFLMLAFPLTIAAATRWEGRRFYFLVAASVVLLALMSVESLTSYAVFP